MEEEIDERRELLTKFIRGLLDSIGIEYSKGKGNLAIHIKYALPESIDILDRAFTHESYSPTDNYEEFEFYGDTVLKEKFTFYLMRKYPKLTKDKLTDLNNTYMSKKGQPSFSRALGLSYVQRNGRISSSLLLYEGEITTGIEADIFESLVGALSMIGNVNYGAEYKDKNYKDYPYGIGGSICEKLISFLFKDITIDTAESYIAPKTAVEQIFTRFISYTGGPPILETERRGNKAICRVILNRRQIDFLRSHGLGNMEKDRLIIGNAEAPSQGEAEDVAYGMALENLRKVQMTPYKAQLLRTELDLKEANLTDEQRTALKSKYTSKGFEYVKFSIPRKQQKSGTQQMQLLGIGPNGTSSLSSLTFVRSKDPQARGRAYRELVLDYINMN